MMHVFKYIFKYMHIKADMKNYAKYILREGNIFEKRKLLTYLKDRLLLADKIVRLAK